MNIYTLEEIIEMLKGKAEQQPPFYGEVTLVWQGGQVVLWREQVTLKPSGTTGGKRRKSRVDKGTD